MKVKAGVYSYAYLSDFLGQRNDGAVHHKGIEMQNQKEGQNVQER